MKQPDSPGPRSGRLVRRGSAFEIIPPAAVAAPLPLPRLPLSTAQWLMAAGDVFHRDKGLCVGFTLLLDCLTRRWLVVLPTQHCFQRRTVMQRKLADYSDLPPHVIIAGSFQTSMTNDVFDASKILPPYDGVHLLVQPEKDKGKAFAFVSSYGERAVADPASILSDDIEDVFRRFSLRLHLPTA